MIKQCVAFILVASVFSASITPTHACPSIGELPDVNCDGQEVITVIGDSLVYGIGDSKNGNQGGYVLRAQTKLPAALFHNQGIPGLRTVPLLQKLSKAFQDDNSVLRQDLLASDLVVIDVGRNDFWLHGPASTTLRNINRARKKIENGTSETTGHTPIVVTAVLMHPNRGSQGPWIKELNALIIRGSSRTAPADLRFDTVSKRLLSKDNIHPTSIGYTAMAGVFVKYLLKEYVQHAKDR